KGLIPALQSKRIDIINSAMYIRPEREEQVDFVPYLTVGNEIVVQAKNPKGIKSREDMCGVKVAVTLGGFQEKLAREDDENCKKAGKAGVEVMTFPTAQDAALALKNGRADAIYNATPRRTRGGAAPPPAPPPRRKPRRPPPKEGAGAAKGRRQHKGDNGNGPR